MQRHLQVTPYGLARCSAFAKLDTIDDSSATAKEYHNKPIPASKLRYTASLNAASLADWLKQVR